jgi:tellurite resistance protein TehA-like permease
LGPRTLAAFLGVVALGLVLYGAGLVTAAAQLKGIGVLFFFMGLVLTAALILRWLIYRQIG